MSNKTIAFGTDHAASEIRDQVIAHLKEQGFTVLDFGRSEQCDYPDVAQDVCKAIITQRTDRGILICGTGIGMSLAANKVSGIRATLCHNQDTASLSRSHNNSNVICLGARILTLTEIKTLVDIWLTTKFQGGRHQNRIDKLEPACHVDVS